MAVRFPAITINANAIQLKAKTPSRPSANTESLGTAK
jgi:hypothetical protein